MHIIYKLTNKSKNTFPNKYIGSKTNCTKEELISKIMYEISVNNKSVRDLVLQFNTSSQIINKYMYEGIKQMYEMLDNDSKTAAFSRNRDRINEELSEES